MLLGEQVRRVATERGAPSGKDTCNEMLNFALQQLQHRQTMGDEEEKTEHLYFAQHRRLVGSIYQHFPSVMSVLTKGSGPPILLSYLESSSPMHTQY